MLFSFKFPVFSFLPIIIKSCGPHAYMKSTIKAVTKTLMDSKLVCLRKTKTAVRLRHHRCWKLSSHMFLPLVGSRTIKVLPKASLKTRQSSQQLIWIAFEVVLLPLWLPRHKNCKYRNVKQPNIC